MFWAGPPWRKHQSLQCLIVVPGIHGRKSKKKSLTGLFLEISPSRIVPPSSLKNVLLLVTMDSFFERLRTNWHLVPCPKVPPCLSMSLTKVLSVPFAQLHLDPRPGKTAFPRELYIRFRTLLQIACFCVSLRHVLSPYPTSQVLRSEW